MLFRSVCLGDDVGVILQTGGTRIVLPGNWEKLDQPETFFVQQRARNSEKGIALSAGTIKIDLTFEQFATLAIAGYIDGPEKQMERIAALAHIPVTEVEQALQSQIGRQTLEQVKQSYRTMSFELLGVTKLEISGAPAYEIHSKLTILQSGQTLFSRQFSYQGTGSKEIVTIGFVGSSEGIFLDKTLFDAIQRPAESFNYATEIDRKTFSLSLPDNWMENKSTATYNSNSFVFFVGPEACIFNVFIASKSKGASVESLVNRQKDVQQKKFTDATFTSTNKWSNFEGNGFEIEGMYHGTTPAFQGTVPYRIMVFGFEKGDKVCVIIENATLDGSKKYANDFETIRQTFKLK